MGTKESGHSFWFSGKICAHKKIWTFYINHKISRISLTQRSAKSYYVAVLWITVELGAATEYYIKLTLTFGSCHDGTTVWLPGLSIWTPNLNWLSAINFEDDNSTLNILTSVKSDLIVLMSKVGAIGAKLSSQIGPPAKQAGVQTKFKLVVMHMYRSNYQV